MGEPYKLVYGTEAQMGSEENRRRFLLVKEKLNWRTGIKSHQELEVIKNSISEDSGPSMLSFLVNFYLIYQGIDEIHVADRVNDLKLHNLLKNQGIPQGIILIDLNLLRYCIMHYVCEPPSTFQRKECLDVFLYMLKLAYNLTEVITRHQRCMFKVITDTYTEFYREWISSAFENAGQHEVPENEWNTLDDDDLKDELYMRRADRNETFRGINEKKQNVENSIRIMLHDQLNTMMQNLTKHKVFSLKVLSSIKVNVDFGEGEVPRDVIEFMGNPLIKEKGAKTPRRLQVPSSGGGRRRFRRIRY